MGETTHLVNLDTDHGRMSPVRRTESVVDVQIRQLREVVPELLHLLRIGLGLLTLGVLGRTFLLGVESEVLEEDQTRRVGECWVRIRSGVFLDEFHGLAHFACGSGVEGVVLRMDLGLY